MLGHCKCGGILDAWKVFQGLDDPNVVPRLNMNMMTKIDLL